MGQPKAYVGKMDWAQEEEVGRVQSLLGANGTRLLSPTRRTWGT